MQALLNPDLRDTVVMEGSENPEIWKTNCEELLTALTEYSKLMEQYYLSTSSSTMKRKVEELEKKVEELKREVRELQEKLKALENTLEASEEYREKKLESFQRELDDLKKAVKTPTADVGDYVLVGQLAHKVERIIVDYVLTKVIGPPQKLYITSLANLQQALNREQNFTQPLNEDAKHKEATKRWEELQRQIGWQERHYRCIEFLKTYCSHTAAADVEISAIKAAIDERRGFPHKSECEELLSMIHKIHCRSAIVNNHRSM